MVNRRKPMLWVAWASFALAACVAPATTTPSDAEAIPEVEIPYGKVQFACEDFPDGDVFILEQELTSYFELFTTSEASAIDANQRRLEEKRKGFYGTEGTRLVSASVSSKPQTIYMRRVSDGCFFAFSSHGMQFLSEEIRYSLFSSGGRDHLSGRLDYDPDDVHVILPHVNDQPTAREPYQELVFRGAEFLYGYYKDISSRAQPKLNSSQGKKFEDIEILR